LLQASLAGHVGAAVGGHFWSIRLFCPYSCIIADALCLLGCGQRASWAALGNKAFKAWLGKDAFAGKCWAGGDALSNRTMLRVHPPRSRK
jgi:hypothetical protein